MALISTSHTGKQITESEFYTTGVTASVKASILGDDEMLFQIGQSVKAASVAESNAYTDTKLTGIDLNEIAELTSEVGMLDDTVTLSPAAASFNLGNIVPIGAAIISVQVRLDTAITGLTGATKVGIGIAADPDKYGKTASLLIGQAINTVPNWFVLTGSEDIRLFAVDNNGAAAGTIGGAAEVIRVRVMYTAAAPIP